jgi:hypothetical protein
MVSEQKSHYYKRARPSDWLHSAVGPALHAGKHPTFQKFMLYGSHMVNSCEAENLPRRRRDGLTHASLRFSFQSFSVCACLLFSLWPQVSYGPPWAHYLGGYQDRLLGGPLGLPDLLKDRMATREGGE